MSAVQTTPAEDLERWEDEGGACYPSPEAETPDQTDPPRHSRMTYRERRLARAEKLRAWADKREQRADAAYERATELASLVPFGQPILIGHHSEKGHRAHLKRIHSAMDQSCESAAMAQRMTESADQIERQAKHAIYSADPDAIQQLTRKVEALTGERDRMKEANAAYRKEHRTELQAMTPFHRDRAIPYPSFTITNLGATIRTAQKRLEALHAQAVNGPSFRTMRSRFASTCEGCGQPIAQGSLIQYARTVGAFHVGCEAA
jgi:DNA repair exonuclease SbcCD ATPase subunit